ncbi:acylpyruvate hydrolase [Virgibacillus subterraneus]|uniref:Acylpyruvate hydrolase n=1 Tax=Virgibacillus subterraneus TaxID=621109 RepID=A0A1H8ZLY0_9BACI|nr:fumarylacetoacetate hydrolase family protein [Virgibacillus subterraneus]SEP65243.1 acylpyruvate hydrolase [Virgibacillus subterraneus]
MKLVSYKIKERPSSFRVGFMLDEKVIDLQEAYRQLLLSKQETDLSNDLEKLLPVDPKHFFAAGNQLIDKAKEAYTYAKTNSTEGFSLNQEEILLSTPIPAPTKIICVGKNYAEHAVEMQSDVPVFPVLFAKFSNALIGPEDVIEKRDVTQKLDYEAELTVVIGKEASQVKKEDALDYIAGYTIGNDISARDLQKRTPQWLQGKTLDKSTPVGPWIVTADEVGNPGNLSIRSTVNGEERQSSNTNKLIFDIPFLIEFISNLVTLKPGDIILTGTPNGVGVAMDPPQFLKDGDVVQIEVEKIGQLKNTVMGR